MSQPRPPTLHDWTKSSYSESSSGGCVEWSPSRAAEGTVPLRDSKSPHGPTVAVDLTAWRTFLTAIRNDDLNG